MKVTFHLVAAVLSSLLCAGGVRAQVSPQDVQPVVSVVSGNVLGGQAVLEWTTSGETGVAGFEVARRGSASQVWVEVWSGMLPAVGFAPNGGFYQLVDEEAEPGASYEYQITVCHIHGGRFAKGPFAVSFPLGQPNGVLAVLDEFYTFTALPPDAVSLARVKKGHGQGSSSVVLTAQATEAVTGVKMGLLSDGFYSVSAAELAPLFGVSEAEVAGWMAGRELAVEHLGRSVAAVYGTNSVSFFGQVLASRYTGANIYWVVRKAGTAVDFLESAPAADVVGQSFATSILIEEDLELPMDLFFDATTDPWMWRKLVPMLNIGKTLRASFDLPGAVAGGTLELRLKGTANTANELSVTLGNSLGETLLGTAAVSGLNYVTWTTSLASVPLEESANMLTITATQSAGESVFVDNFTVAYQRAYVAVSNELFFTADDHAVVTVEGFTSGDITVFDVSTPLAAVEITGLSISGEFGLFRASFVPPVATGRYVAVASGAGRTPATLKADVPSDLHGATNGADFIAIAPMGLINCAELLRDYRAAHGLSAMAVNLQDIYDEFNHGIADPRAIKAFISYAHRMWARSPRYVALIGEGSLDYHNNKDNGDCLIPSLPAYTSFGVQASDQLLVGLNGYGVPDVAIGRLPVMNTAEFMSVLNKIMLFEAGGTWRSNAIALSASAEYGLNFPVDSDIMVELMPNLDVTRIYTTTQSPESARAKLLLEINAGCGLLTYFGHGTRSQFSGNGTTMFATTDIPVLTNAATPMIMLSMTCLSGSFGVTGFDSISEQMVFGSNGAVAVWAAGNEVYGADSRMFCTPLIASIYSNGVSRLGDSLLTAIEQTLEINRVQVAQAYNLLGDPALAIGDIDAPRTGSLAPVDTASYDQWLTWAIAPAANDEGRGLSPRDDPDGDGMSNHAEYRAGTDPMDSGSLLAVGDVTPRADGTVVVRWNSAPHRIYELERTTDLSAADFTLIAADLPARAPINAHTDTTVKAGSAFYRILVK